jgi:SWI/SNF-related matrix-associated actin-dependent regulator of chromatin subfamily A member 5
MSNSNNDHAGHGDDHDDDESSDIEMDGIDMEDDEEAAGEDEDDVDNEEEAATTTAPATPGSVLSTAAADEEDAELEEARKEQAELLAKETTVSLAPATAQDRLNYLLSQSEVFAHFLAGSVTAGGSTAAAAGKKGAGRSGKAGRMTEAEEDALLLKTAQLKRRVIRLPAQPASLSAGTNLYPYQLEGLNWLIKMHDNGINAILADEMGLGKTLQTISLLAYLRERHGHQPYGPSLIIVPKSVVGNWMREFKRFCPVIRVARMGGTKEERVKFFAQEWQEQWQGNKKVMVPTFDALITSYEGFLKEHSRLGNKIKNWKYLIIDEAHRIKNEKSSLSVAVRKLQSDFRLLITGVRDLVGSDSCASAFFLTRLVSCHSCRLHCRIHCTSCKWVLTKRMSFYSLLDL